MDEMALEEDSFETFTNNENSSLGRRSSITSSKTTKIHERETEGAAQDLGKYSRLRKAGKSVFSKDSSKTNKSHH